MDKRRRGDTIYVTTEVEVEFNVEVEDVIDQIEDDELIEELTSRGLIASAMSSAGSCIVSPESSAYSYRAYCDHFGVNYYTSVADISRLVKEELMDTCTKKM